MPLNLHYDPGEPNSAWNWLEHWSSFQFRGPLPQAKGVPNSKPHKQQDRIQTGETELSTEKRGVRKVPTVNVENNPLHSTSEREKSRRNLRKARVHQAEAVQEHHQNELERVKRNLRKITASNSVAPDRSETLPEKPKLNMRKLPSSTASDVPQKSVDNFSEKINDPIVVVSKDSKRPGLEIPPEPLALEETVDMLHHADPAGERLPLETVEKVDNIPKVTEELNVEEQTSKENHRSRRRSFPAKQEYSENVSQRTPTLPSYMAATESAKAKLRAQGSPSFGEDEIENGFVRRHSMPTPANGKLSSVSPRVHRLVQENGKGGSKSDRSLPSSKDGQGNNLEQICSLFIVLLSWAAYEDFIISFILNMFSVYTSVVSIFYCLSCLHYYSKDKRLFDNTFFLSLFKTKTLTNNSKHKTLKITFTYTLH